jgi:putative ABC transport system permease protein
MNISQTLVVSAQQLTISDSAFSIADGSMKSELLRNPAIESVAKSESLPGANIQEISTVSINRLGENSSNGGYEYYCFGVDEDFIPTLGMTLASGRNFDEGAVGHDQVIVNEEAARRLGFFNDEEAVGARVTFIQRRGAESSTIIGVLKNFHHRSPKETHLPMFIYPRERGNYYSLKVNTSDMQGTIASVKATWDKIFPNQGFNYFFLDDKYELQYRSDLQFGKVIAAFSGLTILIACLGLFGLSSYTITQRTKEIGIRKVLGASVSNVVTLLTADFARTIMIAAGIALPVAWFTMDEWLSGYSVRVSLSPWVFVLAIMVILLLALVTVSVQTIRTAMGNPVDSLNHE